MRKEQKEKYDMLVATGAFSEIELAKLRAGFEKPPRNYDHKKSQAHMDAVMTCKQIGKIAGDSFSFEWQPEDTFGDYNAYIYIESGKLFGKAKNLFEKLLKTADEVRFYSNSDMSVGLVYKNLIEEGEWKD